MHIPDISELNVAALLQLIEAAQQRVTHLQAAHRAELVERFTRETKAIGLTVQEALGIANGKRGRPRNSKHAGA